MAKAAACLSGLGRQPKSRQVNPLGVQERRKSEPYYYVSYPRKGKSSTKFVENDLLSVRKQPENNERMRLLTNRCIYLATELSTLHLNKETD
jgi:hypothetical protein